jgi:type II secretory pathway component PulM
MRIKRMATPNMEVKVSVEKVVHEHLREIVQVINNKYGLRISQLNFDWLERHQMGEPTTYEVSTVRALTISGG